MKVKFKLNHPNAVLPSYSKPGDNGLDLTAVEYKYVDDGISPYHEYQLGLSVEIPPGYVGLLVPRSSSTKKDLFLSNSMGVIDTNFRGSLSARFKEVNRPDGRRNPELYFVGDRVVQLLIIPCPKIEVEEASVLSETVRGNQGWGSSGA